MVRKIIFDTETTGLKAQAGDRLVEIAAIELENYTPTGNFYQQYIDPERDMPDDAFQVHGLSAHFLKKYPVFAEIATAFLHFIRDAVLIAHNASFDMDFINAELRRINVAEINLSRSVDTLQLARKKLAAKGLSRFSLDALCRYYKIDLSKRGKHSALLDCELLAEVYKRLQGWGEQSDFILTPTTVQSLSNGLVSLEQGKGGGIRKRPYALKPLLTPAEKAAHSRFIAQLKNPLWR